MLSHIHLKNFKSFRELKLELGALNVLIGANASGKSNFREALRFLHGVGRGYSLIEILGEKWGEGGDLLWTGLRGGPREAVFSGATSFDVEIELRSLDDIFSYGISIAFSRVRGLSSQKNDISSVNFLSPIVTKEYLKVNARPVFETGDAADGKTLHVVIHEGAPTHRSRAVQLSHSKPVLGQLAQTGHGANLGPSLKGIVSSLTELSFLEPDPQAIRRPSFPGSPLGNHGENLPSAMLDLFEKSPELEASFREHLYSLTPLDVENFEFRPDRSGRLELSLREANGREISLSSASDGTVRYLALLTALMREDGCLFLEEVETGLHPSRLALLLDCLRESSTNRRNQIFITSHSPLLLHLLGPAAFEQAYLTYRSEESGESSIRRLQDIPDAKDVLETQDLGRLHTSGWFEDVSYFAESPL